MRRERAPLITPDIRNFHNLFHAPGSLRYIPLPLPTTPPERAAIGGGLFVTHVRFARGSSSTCECINTGCTHHKLRVESQARGQRLISYLDKGTLRVSPIYCVHSRWNLFRDSLGYRVQGEFRGWNIKFDENDR